MSCPYQNHFIVPEEKHIFKPKKVILPIIFEFGICIPEIPF